MHIELLLLLLFNLLLMSDSADRDGRLRPTRGDSQQGNPVAVAMMNEAANTGNRTAAVKRSDHTNTEQRRTQEQISIHPPPPVTDELIVYEPGNMPIIILAPHDGRIEPTTFHALVQNSDHRATRRAHDVKCILRFSGYCCFISCEVLRWFGYDSS